MKSCNLVLSIFVIFGVSIAQINGDAGSCLRKILDKIFGDDSDGPSESTCAPCPTEPTATCPPTPPTEPPTYGSSLPCGTFVQYDINSSSVVVENGFSGGVYKDGSQAYVGLGINLGSGNSPCFWEYNCPGRISVEGTQGVYMSCANGVLDKFGTRFLVNHPDLHWVPIAEQTLTTDSKLVTIHSDVYHFYFGRKILTENGQNYTTVSKVHDNGVMMYSDGTSDGYAKSTSDYEVLSC